MVAVVEEVGDMINIVFDAAGAGAEDFASGGDEAFGTGGAD